MRRFALGVLVLAVACRPASPNFRPDNQVIVEEVRLEGFDVLPPDVREHLDDALPLRAGVALTDETQKAAGERAVELLQNNGRPYAQVGIVREPIDQTRSRVIIRAEPGPLGVFGAVDIAGNRRVDDRIIRRRLAYAPGDLFRRSAIEQSQQRLGASGLFKSIAIRAHDIDAQPAAVPTLVTVEEGSPWKWNVGAGYAAGERLAVDARISHLNVLGSARRVDVLGRVSAIERTGEVFFTQNDSWHPSLSFTLQARHQEIEQPAFFVTSRGGQAAVSWQWTRNLSTTGSYAVAVERSNVGSSLGPLLGLEDGMLSAWSLDVDHRNVRPDSSVADTVAIHFEQAGQWMPGTFNYVSMIGDARHYRSRLDGKVVFATRLRLGTIDPANGEADVPLLKRFFLGGSNEMRGWGVYELSPLSASGEPVGGKSLMTASAELRVPVFKRLRGALFVEAGNVWQDALSLRLSELRYDAGPGIRLDTPFGLIRIDIGYQLRPLEGLRIDGKPQRSRWRIILGIGEAF